MSQTPSSEREEAPTRAPLLGEFPPSNQADWRQAVDGELKGVPFEKRLVSRTYEGIDLQPLYSREQVAALPHQNSWPGLPPYLRGRSASGYLGEPWAVSQELDSGGTSEFNAAARESLARGLTALNMVLDRATRNGADPDSALPGEVGRGGVSIANLADLSRAFEGIDLRQVTLFVRSGASALPFTALLLALARHRGDPVEGLRGCIEMDPLGVMAHEGSLPQSLAQAYAEMAALTQWAVAAGSRLQTVCVHGRAWHEAGGTAVQELAFALATGLEYLRAMSERGLEVNDVAPRIRFAFTVGTQFFTEIAKLRAARLLWSRLVRALGGGPSAQALSIHVRTSLWNKTVYDPHTNVLRSTVEAFAGVLAGCDSLQVGAFDEVIRVPDDFSRRLARNTQLVLQKECHLDHVIDPAGGSWFVETLTDQLARKAWELFQDVERRGGMAQAMRDGFPQEAVAKAARDKLQNAARRRDVIVGLNQFANLSERVLPGSAPDLGSFQRRRAREIMDARTAGEAQEHASVVTQLSRIMEPKAGELAFQACIEAVLSGATLGEITRALRANDRPEPPVVPVRLTRVALPFERLRSAMDRYAEREGHRVRVFLVNLGPLAQHKARADFSRGFFEVGGFEVISPDGFSDAAVAAQAAIDSGARIAVICSTDETYPELVPPLVSRLRAGKPDLLVVLAGYPADQVEAHRRAGVDEFIHVRANALELLQSFQHKLGVTDETLS